MSIDSEFSASANGAAGRRSSKGLNLDDIKFIDDEDDRGDFERTIKSFGRHGNSNYTSNRGFTPGQDTILEDVPTVAVVRPLSNERLEAKRQKVQRLRKKVDASAEKAASRAGIDSNVSHQHLPTINRKLDKPTDLAEHAKLERRNSPLPRHESTPQPTAISDFSTKQREERDSVNKSNRDPFERRGFMRDHVKERKKKSITNRANDVHQQAVLPQADGEESSESERSDACPSDNELPEAIVAKSPESLRPAGISSSTERIINNSSVNPPRANVDELHSTANERTTQLFEKFSSSNHYREPSIKHLHHRFVGRKQKSLRQKVLRKLGQQAILSNSSPDINEAVEAEENNYESSEVTGETEVKLKRHQAFRAQRRPSSPAVLTRCQSEGDLLYDSSSSEDDTHISDKMRTLELSEETFLETYGVIPRRKKKGKDARPVKRHTTYNLKNPFLDFTLQGNESDGGALNDRRRRLSAGESGSSHSSVGEGSSTSSEPAEKSDAIPKQPLGKSKSDGTHDAVILRRPRSTGSDDGASTPTPKNREARNSWIPSFAPNFGKKSNKESPTREPPKGTRKFVFNPPASRLTNASHKGYLDKRNKKKQWERLWCVLQDSCLYMYNSPQSNSTEDAVVLRGYNVVANVKNVNRSRFTFRLERHGSPTIHLSAESDREYMLWVGTLEKETSMVLPGSTDNEILISAIKQADVQAKMKDQDPKSKTVDKSMPGEEFQLQKEHLLREVLEKTQKVVEEQRLLQEKHSNSPLPITVSPPTTTAKISKSQLNEKFQRAREEEKLKSTKHLTHLNKRRNSAQIKVDQITKQLAPKSGRRRRENPKHFADMEAKLSEMQNALAEVDKEIAERQAMRQDTIDKINQRLDLEMLILEQRDMIDIIQRHGAWKSKPSSSPQNPRRDSNDKLPSIHEIASSESSSVSSYSMQNSLSPESRTTTPSPCKSFEAYSPKLVGRKVNVSNMSREIGSSSDELDAPHKGVDQASLKDVERDNSKDEVDPSILAGIEDFQRFSRKKLASLANQRS